MERGVVEEGTDAVEGLERLREDEHLSWPVACPRVGCRVLWGCGCMGRVLVSVCGEVQLRDCAAASS